MTQASVRLRPYGIISGNVLTRARLPIARIFGERPAAKDLDLVFVPVGQRQKMTLWWVFAALKSRRSYHVFITSALSPRVLLTLRQPSIYSHLTENKLAEACASRTHRRHQRCRPPVLKITRLVLTGYENSLLYSILCLLSRTGVLPRFDSF
jgi:hypothetical protein